MRANPQDQKSLLELVRLDLDLIRNSAEKAKLVDSDEIEKASAVALALSDEVIDARNRVGDLELELKRSESDLELVEKRIAKDQERLVTTSSPKDAQGIEHELGSLSKRKSDLEDAELDVMENLDQARLVLAAVTEQRIVAEKHLAQLHDDLTMSVSSLEKNRANLISSREALIATLDSGLATAYERKASRGVAVGRLVGRECGACRLSITATNLDEIISLPSDEIAECPNCQAYLVRT